MSSQPLRVLVVDDEDPIRLLCRVNLEAEGIDVEEAANGVEGLELARSYQPDLILLDVMMPGLDGCEVAKRLFDDPETAGIPVIFLTARADIRDRLRGIDSGGLEYITKPFDPIELPERIRSLLARYREGEGEELRLRRRAELEQQLNVGG